MGAYVPFPVSAVSGVLTVDSRASLASLTLAGLLGTDKTDVKIRTYQYYDLATVCPFNPQTWVWSATDLGLSNSIAADASITGYWVQEFDRSPNPYDFGAFGGFSKVTSTGPDDTTALQNWLVCLGNNTVFPSGANGYIPADIFGTTGDLVIPSEWGSQEVNTGRITIRGAGPSISIIVLTHATNSCMVTEPNSSYGGPVLEHFSIVGLGSTTTGNLLEIGSINTTLRSMYFSGTGGRAILLTRERVRIEDTQVSGCRQALVCAAGQNESYFEMNVIDPGSTANGLSSGTLYYYSRNATNGVFPASGALVQDHHGAVVFRALQNCTLRNFTIKNMTKGIAGIRITNGSENVKISHGYLEGTVNPSHCPSIIYGGQPEKTTTTATLAVAALDVAVVDSKWFDSVFSTVGRIPPGSGSVVNYVIYPPDYNSADGSASSIGGTILKNSYEIVRGKGFVGTTFYIESRAGNGTTALEWPAGAVVMDAVWLETTTSSGGKVMATAGTIEIDNVHLRSQNGSVTSPWSLTPNYDLGETNAQIVLGITRQVPHFINTTSVNYGLKLSGPSITSGAGKNRIEVLGACTVTCDDLATFTQSALDPTGILTLGISTTVAPITYTDTTHGTARVKANGEYTSSHSGNVPAYWRTQISDGGDGNDAADIVTRFGTSKDFVIEDGSRAGALPNHKFVVEGNTRDLTHRVWDGAGETSADYTVRARIGQISGAREALTMDTVIRTQGAGTPEGAVTAPVGSTYCRTDGGAGTSFYVKESGAGNTGWVAK